MNPFENMTPDQLERYVQIKRAEISAIQKDMRLAQEMLSQKVTQTRAGRLSAALSPQQKAALQKRLKMDGIESEESVSG